MERLLLEHLGAANLIILKVIVKGVREDHSAECRPTPVCEAMYWN